MANLMKISQQVQILCRDREAARQSIRVRLIHCQIHRGLVTTWLVLSEPDSHLPMSGWFIAMSSSEGQAWGLGTGWIMSLNWRGCADL